MPSGVWDATEYAKLPAYDRPTGEQPTGLFLCHQHNDRVCSGWAACHDMNDNLALRMAAITGTLTPTEHTAVLDYDSPVPVFPTGAAAAAHGLQDLRHPGASARRVIAKLDRRAPAP